MTAKKTTTVVQVEKDSGPSFSSVWKWITGTASAVAATALLAIAAWVWNINGTIITLQNAVENNTDSIKAHESRLTHLSEVDATTAATLAAMQVQIPSAQTVQSGINLSLADRIRSLEQQNIWRDRMAPRNERR